MWKITMVEDNDAEAARVAEYIGRYGRESGEAFDVKRFADAETFLADYDADCDVVFMDIQLPDMSGMDAARRLREIYLRSFEIVFKEAKADVRYLDDQGNVQVIKDFKAGMATMTSFNCIGDTWAGGNRALITDVLRGEWGFEGFVLTDSVRTDFMYADQMLRAGGDACLMSTEIPIYDLDSATALNCLQSSVKNICYTVAHSNAMNGVAPGSTISYGLAPWAIGLLIGNIVIYGLIIGGIVWIILRAHDAKKNPDKYKH